MLVEKARRSLVNAQARDGRVCVSPQNPDACWPTPLAVLAWLRAPQYDLPRNKAIRFLLNVEQVKVFDAAEATSEGHDETIKGWPWIAGTHPWVEPTAYSLMALRVCGYLVRDRTYDAVRLLIDRQLPSGGWNYGNTFTFQKEMRPMPETTGLSLAALAGLAPKTAVEKSILYLRSQLASLDTPMSLAWAVLGLHAWQERLEQPRDRILRVLARQEQLGPHDTVSLCLLLLAYYCDAGLVRFLEGK